VSLIWSDNGDGTISLSTRQVKRFILDEDFRFPEELTAVQGPIEENSPVTTSSGDERLTEEESIPATAETMTREVKDESYAEIQWEAEASSTLTKTNLVFVAPTKEESPGSDNMSSDIGGINAETNLQRGSSTKGRVGNLIKMFEKSARGDRAIETRGSSPCGFELHAGAIRDPTVLQKEKSAPQTNISQDFATTIENAVKPSDSESSVHLMEPWTGIQQLVPANNGSALHEHTYSGIDGFPAFTYALVEDKMPHVDTSGNDGHSEKSSSLYTPDEDGYESLLDTPMSQDSSIFPNTIDCPDDSGFPEDLEDPLQIQASEDMDSMVCRDSRMDYPAPMTIISEVNERSSTIEQKSPIAVSEYTTTRSSSNAFERLRANFEKHETPDVYAAAAPEVEETTKSSLQISTIILSELLNTPLSSRSVEKKSSRPRSNETRRSETEERELEVDSVPSDESERPPQIPSNESEAPTQIERPDSDIPFDEGSAETFEQDPINLMDSRDDFHATKNDLSQALLTDDHNAAAKVLSDGSEFNIQDDSHITTGQADALVKGDFDAQATDRYESFEPSDSRSDSNERLHSHHRRKNVTDFTNKRVSGVDAVVHKPTYGTKKSNRLSELKRRENTRKIRNRSREESNDWAGIILKSLSDVREPCEGAMLLCGANDVEA
jgi:hypothetical protein